MARSRRTIQGAASAGGLPPDRIRMPHWRAPNYLSTYADGILSRAEEGFVTLVFFQNDMLIKSERMEAIERNEVFSTYRSAEIDEERGRTDIVAVRVPIGELFGTVERLRQGLQAGKGVSE